MPSVRTSRSRARARLLTLALGVSLAGLVVSAWQLAACNGGCTNEVSLAIIVDAESPDQPGFCNACSIAAGSTVPWPGSCFIVDAGPPMTVGCPGMACLE